MPGFLECPGDYTVVPTVATSYVTPSAFAAFPASRSISTSASGLHSEPRRTVFALHTWASALADPAPRPSIPCLCPASPANSCSSSTPRPGTASSKRPLCFALSTPAMPLRQCPSPTRHVSTRSRLLASGLCPVHGRHLSRTCGVSGGWPGPCSATGRGDGGSSVLRGSGERKQDLLMEPVKSLVRQ